MGGITEAAVKRYWVVMAVTATVVAGGAAWAASINADVNALKVGVDSLRSEQKDTVMEIRRLREAMIRAGTAKDGE